MKGDLVAYTFPGGTILMVEDKCGCGRSDCIATQAHMEMATRLVSIGLSFEGL